MPHIFRRDEDSFSTEKRLGLMLFGSLVWMEGDRSRAMYLVENSSSLVGYFPTRAFLAPVF